MRWLDAKPMNDVHKALKACDGAHKIIILVFFATEEMFGLLGFLEDETWGIGFATGDGHASRVQIGNFGIWTDAPNILKLI